MRLAGRAPRRPDSPEHPRRDGAKYRWAGATRLAGATPRREASMRRPKLLVTAVRIRCSLQRDDSRSASARDHSSWAGVQTRNRARASIAIQNMRKYETTIRSYAAWLRQNASEVVPGDLRCHRSPCSRLTAVAMRQRQDEPPNRSERMQRSRQRAVSSRGTCALLVTRPTAVPPICHIPSSPSKSSMSSSPSPVRKVSP